MDRAPPKMDEIKGTNTEETSTVGHRRNMETPRPSTALTGEDRLRTDTDPHRRFMATITAMVTPTGSRGRPLRVRTTTRVRHEAAMARATEHKILGVWARRVVQVPLVVLLRACIPTVQG